MPEDTKDSVQPDAVPEGTESKEEKPEVKEETPQVQPLTEEKVQQMLSEQGEQISRRLQSEKDRAVAEVRREADKRVRFAESETAGIKSSLGDLDEGARDAVELARLRARDQHFQSFEMEENARRMARETYDTFNANMNQFVTELGVDPKDINWGDESEPLLQKQQRILGDIGKIQKTKDKELKDSIPRLVKEEVAKERQAQGLDSVPTDTSGGVSGSDEDFLDKFGKGEIPATKENVERAKKLTE